MSAKTFFDHIGEWFKDHFASHTWQQKASLAIALVRPLLLSLTQAAAGSTAETKVAGVVGQVTTDLNDIEAVINGAETTGGFTLQSALSSLQTNMSDLVADADVKNSAKASEIVNFANTILAEVQAIAAAVPSDFAAPVHGAASN